MNTKVIYQGVDTGFAGGNLYWAMITNIQDLTGYKATFKLCDIVIEFDDITSKKVTFNLTAEQTASLPIGVWQSSFTILDTENRVCANFTDTLFDIRRNPNA